MKFLFYFFSSVKKKDVADCKGPEDEEERGKTGLIPTTSLTALSTVTVLLIIY